MKLVNDVTVQCEKCGAILVIPIDFFDSQVYSCERNMGEEITCIFTYETECEECSNNISIEITGIEYPVGAFNYESFDIEGAEFVEEPGVTVECYYEYPDEYFEESKSEMEFLVESIISNPELIYEVNPRKFEELVEIIFQSRGFKTKLTQQTRDGGKDIYATTVDALGNPLIYLIECKRFGKKNTVGVEIVRGVFGTHMDEKPNKSIIVTTSKFSLDAKKFAERQNHQIDLIDGEQFLKQLLDFRNCSR